MSTRIYLEPARMGERGQRYRVIYDGAVLIESSRNPEFDAGRMLLVRGITGQVEICRPGASFPAMRLDIEKGARLTVDDGDEGLRFVRWRPRSLDWAPDAVSYRAGSPAAGANERAAGTLAHKKSAVLDRSPGPNSRSRNSETMTHQTKTAGDGAALRDLNGVQTVTLQHGPLPITAANRAAMAELQRIMEDHKQPIRSRLEAAAALAPYMRPTFEMADQSLNIK